MSNNEIRIKKKHLTIAAIAVIATSLIIPYQIFAQNTLPVPPSASEDTEPINAPTLASPAQAALTNVIAMPSNNAVSEKSWYLISFTTATTGTVKKIEVTFPSGFNVANAKLIEKTGIGGGTLSVSGQTVTYTIGSAVSVPAGTKITLMISEVVNSGSVNNKVTVTTRNASNVIIDGPTLSATFTLKRITSSMIQDGTIVGADITCPLVVDSATFAVDCVNNRVGIGTTTPDKPLTITAEEIGEELVSFKDPSGVTKWHINQNLGGTNPGLNFVETGVADGRLFISRTADCFLQ
jgi:hypothetical protein